MSEPSLDSGPSLEIRADGVLVELIPFWLLMMMTAELWFDGTRILLNPETYVRWVFWGHLLFTGLCIVVGGIVGLGIAYILAKILGKVL